MISHCRNLKIVFHVIFINKWHTRSASNQESRKKATEFCNAVTKAVRKVDRGFAQRADCSRWANADQLVYLPGENLDREAFEVRAAEKGLAGQWIPEGFRFLPPLTWGNTEHRRVGCDLLAILLGVSGFEVTVVKKDPEKAPALQKK